MAVTKVSNDRITKDGRKWYFYTTITQPNGVKKRYNSKKYLTKSEAQKAEHEFVVKEMKHEINLTDMTFSDLYDEFYIYKSDKVKSTTLRTYKERRTKFAMLEKVKLRDFNINHYQQWRTYIGSLDIKVKTKNHYHKFLKELLNYGTKWHDLNFVHVYTKMEKFTDPNAAPTEMEYYTYEEFKQFLSVEDDLRFKAIFETLYYCGLRRGELRGLTWDNINFEDKTLSVVKNVVNENGDSGYWKITTPKTRTSTRTIPMPDILVKDLQSLKDSKKKHINFSDKWFVFGDINPLHPDVLRRRKNENAKKAGVKQIRIHDFRHSCASVLINNGANIMIVAKYLGHAKIDETLNTYTHLFKNKMDDVVNLMNKLSNE
jgi:integrase